MYHQEIQETQDYITLRNYFSDQDKFYFFLFGGNRNGQKMLSSQNKKVK